MSHEHVFVCFRSTLAVVLENPGDRRLSEFSHRRRQKTPPRDLPASAYHPRVLGEHSVPHRQAWKRKHYDRRS